MSYHEPVENRSVFIYNDMRYEFVYDPKDPSGLGCVGEIVSRNDYDLNQFSNIKNGSIIDIGANCGVATIILAKQNPESTVYAFEPDPDVYRFLLKNVNANNLKNVKTFNEAVSKKGVNELTLYKSPLCSGGNTTYSNDDLMKNHFHQEINSVTIKCTSFDEIIDTHNITSVDLLKIDCEGAEFDIIYDSEHIKNNIVKNIVGEFHDLIYNDIGHKSPALIEYCHKVIPGVKLISVLKI